MKRLVIDKKCLQSKPLSLDEQPQYSADEQDVIDILKIREKCLKTEPQMVENKKMYIYRTLSTASIAILQQDGFKVEVLEEPKSGVKYILSWE